MVSFPKKDWRGIVGVILKEGLTGHSRCHTQIRIRGIVGVIIKKDWPRIVGVIFKEGLARHSQYHIERTIGGALGGANPSLSMTPTTQYYYSSI